MIQATDRIPGRILIVDDEPPLLRMMSLYLTRLGYTVTTAGTTEKAWAEVEAAPADFACAVLDATMSGLSMQDLALKILAANSSVRVLAASGYPVDMSDVEAQAPGRVDFLHKPFTPEMLAKALRRMLAPQEESL
jgi:two-component system cell cycle sensor histidine kinase/response regulator CckA